MDGAPWSPQSRAALTTALPWILEAPKDDGALRMIISRPEPGARELPASVGLSVERGVEGDHWSKGCWRVTEDGRPHPDVQICLMMARCIEAIAGDESRWPPAGDNLFIDMDLTPANTPPGARLRIGSALLIVTDEPHNGCAAFAERFGRDACAFVNVGPGKTHRLRGIYARVLQDGVASVGDRVAKIET